MISVLLASSILAAGAVSSGALSGTDDTAPAGETWTQPANLADLVENVSPSVVQITAKDKPALDLSANGDPRSSRQLFDEFMHRFFPKSGTGPDPRRSPSTGIGSGFVISSDGVIVTNHHVINHAGEISVTFSNGRVFNAEVLGSDPRTDLAVLKVEDGEEFQAIDWGGSDAVRVGDPVF
ncbi:MAG: trypsin-like peptidase domain-containing protein, partial [Pseudomonadota bacterium]